MSGTNPLNDADRDGTERGRYASMSVDGSHVVYDRENHDAWVQSDRQVDLEEVR